MQGENTNWVNDHFSLKRDLPTFQWSNSRERTLITPVQWRSSRGDSMDRTILLLAILVSLAVLAQSKSVIDLAGNEGNLLLSKLTNNSTSNNSTLTLPINDFAVNLSGENGSSLMNEVNNASKNLSDWGNKPPKAPLPPGYDSKTAQTVEILRENHGF
jgi:hypothetical protein